jgi:tRNA nucleotidyltransferase (CCA-adding enzyme)
MVTRITLDLAAHHHLQQRTMRELLAGAPPVIEPQASIARLRRLMTRDDVGQVAVVDEGKLVGIVTRTDLLAYARQQSRARHTTGRRVDLAAALDAEHLAAIHAIHDLADAREERIYLVGGLPRDLVLGRPYRADIDLVVVGDAVELARAAAETMGGEAVRHGRFGTAKWRHGAVTIDLVTARAETYAKPGALPTVTAGSLRADLRRRDFTINTLALDLAAERFGQVIDLFGGLDDLDQGTLRVLHGLSFVEDPTRILRAVRFEQRLGFEMDGHTEQLARGAVSWLHAVSGARIANELRQAMGEPRPARVLARLDALGALDALVPDLGFDDQAGEVQAALPATWEVWRTLPTGRKLAEEVSPAIRLLAWLAGQGETGQRAAGRLILGRREREILAQTADTLDDATWQAPDARPSAIYRALRSRRPEALLLAELLCPDRHAAQRLRHFASELAGREPLLAGDDLKGLAAPGPRFGDVLRDVHEALLDGRIATRDEAMSLARQLLADEPG